MAKCIFPRTINLHRSSFGEKLCASILNHLKIQYIPEYNIPRLPHKKYDFYFKYRGDNFLLEWDGRQHFMKWGSERRSSLLKRQQGDIVKTREALKSGYKIIRLDYTQQPYVIYHLTRAFQENKKLYLSNPGMYRYITLGL